MKGYFNGLSVKSVLNKQKKPQKFKNNAVERKRPDE